MSKGTGYKLGHEREMRRISVIDRAQQVLSGYELDVRSRGRFDH